MSRRSRATLKNYFGPGARPTTDQFGDLIDSSLIMDDEGFHKTETDGLSVITLGGGDALLSFQRPSSKGAEWSIGFLDGTTDGLALKRGGQKSPWPGLLTFETKNGSDPEAQVGLNARLMIAPEAPPGEQDVKLEVGGTLRANGRIGREWQAPADGKFHSVSEMLGGCVALEVMAGVGSPDEGRFALLHGVAMNAFNPMWWDDILGLKKRIRQHHAYYSRHSDRLELRWSAQNSKDPAAKYGHDARFSLQIRSRSDYENPNSIIKAYVTQLWFDPFMKWAKKPAADGQAAAAR